MGAGRDPARDDDREGHWLTYAQLAEVRQIDKASAIKLATRRGWRRQRDNRGTMTVYVPVEAQAPDRDAARDNDRDVSLAVDREDYRNMAAELSRIADGYQDAVQRITEAKDSEISTLREQLTNERDRNESALARNAALEAKVGEVLHQVVDLESRLHHESRVAKEALEMAEALRQAEAERRGQGRWRRLRAAWRGE